MALDFIAGCIGGCAGVLVGHPLDTVKVHLQTQNPKNPIYRGTWHCLSTIWKHEKFRGLYRGMTSPMAGIGGVNAIVFGIYGNIQRQTKDPDSLYSHCLAGSVAGFCQSIVCAPMELAKTRMQLQHDKDPGLKFKCPLDCMKHIMKTEGIRGTFNGLGITALRDVPGFAAYFVSYEYLIRLTSAPNALHFLFAGGVAGICSWLACYPTDVIKTALQADGMNSAKKFTGIMDVARQGYKHEGYHFFFRGLLSTLIRSFPMNAACFYVVALIMSITEPSKVSGVVNTEPLMLISISSEHNAHNERRKQKIKQHRNVMQKSLKYFAAMENAVTNEEIVELADHFYSQHQNYFISEDNELHDSRFDLA